MFFFFAVHLEQHADLALFLTTGSFPPTPGTSTDYFTIKKKKKDKQCLTLRVGQGGVCNTLNHSSTQRMQEERVKLRSPIKRCSLFMLINRIKATTRTDLISLKAASLAAAESNFHKNIANLNQAIMMKLIPLRSLPCSCLTVN